MSTTTLLFVGLLVLSFLFARVFKEFRTRWLFYTGLLYVVLGLLLGPRIGLGVLSESVLQALTPLALLLSGVVGFIIGLRVKQILGKDASVAGLLTALAVFLAVGVGLLASVSALYAFTGRELPSEFLILARLPYQGEMKTLAVSSQLFWLCLTLAAAGAVTSSSMIISAQSILKAKGKITMWLITTARTTEFVTLFAYGLFLSSSRALETADLLGLSVTEWVVAATGSGILCGLLFTLFIGKEGDETRIYFASIGAIIFASGIGSALGVSPLFVNLVTGATVALSSKHTARLRAVLENLQEPVFVLLFILAGAFWEPLRGWAWGVPAVAILFRLLGLFGLASLLTRGSLQNAPKVARMGTGLVGQDAVPLAIGLTFSVRYPDQAPLVLTAVLMGYVFSNIVGSISLRRLLVDNQELGATKA